MLVLLGGIPENGDKRDVEVHIDDFDTWNANTTLALVAVPLLMAYKADKTSQHTTPMSFEQHGEPGAHERWYAVIDEMIFAFSAFLPDADTSEDDPRVQAGLRLFAEHFASLWN